MSVRFGIRTILAITILAALLLSVGRFRQQLVRWGILPNVRTIANKVYEVDDLRLYKVDGVEGLPDNVILAIDNSADTYVLETDRRASDRIAAKHKLGRFKTLAITDLNGDGNLDLLCTNAEFPSHLGEIVNRELHYLFADGTNQTESMTPHETDWELGIAFRLNDMRPFPACTAGTWVGGNGCIGQTCSERAYQFSATSQSMRSRFPTRTAGFGNTDDS